MKPRKTSTYIHARILVNYIMLKDKIATYLEQNKEARVFYNSDKKILYSKSARNI